MELLEFIKNSPTAFHAVANVCSRLTENGYTELFENEIWKIEPGTNYFVVRDGSSVIAFSVPQCEYIGLSVCATHTDSPSFKIKSNPEVMGGNGLVRLNIEAYGGMNRETWFDRPLSVAGRVTVSENGKIKEYLVNIERSLVVIPSLAIHMGKAHSEDKINIQTEMLPIFRSEEAQTEFIKLIAENIGAEPNRILGCDLYLYNCEAGTVFGAENEFFASSRIDNLENVYLSLNAFLKSKKNGMLKIFAAFDNEETGSLTNNGAESTFFTATMDRINESLKISRGKYLAKLASSFILSADNAHAAHPNYMGKADIINRPRLNGGVVIKYNASGRYTTDAVSAAIVKELCVRCGVPFMEYHNRSDIAGGSTLGNLMNRQISVKSADVGLAQLAMHSAYETAGVHDAEFMERFMTEFYSTEIRSKYGEIHLNSKNEYI